MIYFSTPMFINGLISIEKVNNFQIKLTKKLMRVSNHISPSLISNIFLEQQKTQGNYESLKLKQNLKYSQY